MKSAAALVFWAAAIAVSPSARAEVIDGNRIVIIDGDTVALPCAVPARGCAEKIRFLDIDAPESFRPHCDHERAVGLQAKARVAELLRGATVYIERARAGKTATGARWRTSRRRMAMSARCCCVKGWQCPTGPAKWKRPSASRIGVAQRLIEGWHVYSEKPAEAGFRCWVGEASVRMNCRGPKTRPGHRSCDSAGLPRRAAPGCRRGSTHFRRPTCCCHPCRRFCGSGDRPLRAVRWIRHECFAG